MSQAFCFAVLIEESPYFGLFEGGRVPIVSSFKVLDVPLEGERDQDCFFVDLEALTAEQLEGIVGILAGRSGEAADLIREEVLERGLPLRGSQVEHVLGNARRFS